MQLACPKCGTREVRISHRRNLLERFRGLFGVCQIRCRRCRTRWETSVWSDGAWRYARCPKCYRQELTTWSEHYYHPPRWIVMQLRLGATPYRCAACRCNFASFKQCKERFSWRHQTHVDPGRPAPVGDVRQEPAEVRAVSGKHPQAPPEDDFDEPML